MGIVLLVGSLDVNVMFSCIHRNTEQKIVVFEAVIKCDIQDVAAIDLVISLQSN